MVTILAVLAIGLPVAASLGGRREAWKSPQLAVDSGATRVRLLDGPHPGFTVRRAGVTVSDEKCGLVRGRPRPTIEDNKLTGNGAARWSSTSTWSSTRAQKPSTASSLRTWQATATRARRPRCGPEGSIHTGFLPIPSSWPPATVTTDSAPRRRPSTRHCRWQDRRRCGGWSAGSWLLRAWGCWWLSPRRAWPDGDSRARPHGDGAPRVPRPLA